MNYTNAYTLLDLVSLNWADYKTVIKYNHNIVSSVRLINR